MAEEKVETPEVVEVAETVVNEQVAPEKIVTRVKTIHNVHPTGTGLLNVLASLECGGLALLQNMVSITGGQSVSVIPDQIVGAITEDHVLKAYSQGFEKGTQEKDKPKSVKIKRKIEAAKEIEAELKDKK